ncbi:uncharacterized protein FIBRA_05759 [Fibroporia radiculosa]|uniref:DNA 3'-5' helicase n=1 Tax=Fibroporia radiculosa TaxID=599839 RepID=J4HY22_9APHY|nr:uncharacterized protein FIBRA_05759 [Fibroporia radiculosa]CCM03617.1 predicted protein [Fibroporia radiculosa]
MNGPDFEDLVHEYGLDDMDYSDHRDDSGIAFLLNPVRSDLESIDDLIEEYENSSPSPPERRSAIGGRRPVTYRPPFARHPGPGLATAYDEFEDVEEPYQTHQLQTQYQLNLPSRSSAYRSPNFDRRPGGTNSSCELTGDTVQFGKSAWGNARDASIIITTGEKWDSLTRNWRDHGQILSQIQLFLVDEVHILNESRGSTMEVILSRMKTRGSAVRFVVVSATVPNIEDVASWIGNGTPEGSATVMQFGEEFRPCKLSKFVYGIHRKKDQNDFVFQKTLDFRLYSILQQHSADKPTLVFCSTRVVGSAEHILKEYEDAVQKKAPLPWTHLSRIEHTFQDKRLEKLAARGIGVHHAGMSMEDRRTTEDMFLKKILQVLFATSTLAVGVNLPAHTVIIKGVKIFQNNSSQEYSDLDIMQMMGRAGRPQFDKEGIAIILCETELEAKYNALVQGHSLLESCLHLNLSEHLNSEIGLGTITDLDSAKEWLRNSFLYQRIRKNPKHYAIGKEGSQTWQERIDGMVTESITNLRESELVVCSDGDEDRGQLCSTDYGDIMSKFYVKQWTMNSILQLSDRASMRDILETISNAEEFSDIKIRSGEKQVYNKMRAHNDIRFQIKKVEKPSDKIFLLIQAVLGCISLSDPDYKKGDNNPTMEGFSVFRHVVRIAKGRVRRLLIISSLTDVLQVVAEVAIVKRAGALLKHSLEVIRCLSAKAWEDRHTVLRQVEHIGEKSLKVLAEYGITTLSTLRIQEPLRLEALLNRRPPFGHEVLAAVQQLPEYTLNINEIEVTTHGGKKAVEVELLIECGLITDGTPGPKMKKAKNKFTDMTTVLTLTSDLDFIDFRRIPTKALKETKTFTLNVELRKPSQSIVTYISSESIAGVTVSQSYKTNIAAKQFPPVNTRPHNSVGLLLEGLDDVPDFWNMDPDDDDRANTHPMNSQNYSAVGMQKGAEIPNSSVTQTKIRVGNDTSKVQLGFKMLSNGNYE